MMIFRSNRSCFRNRNHGYNHHRHFRGSHHPHRRFMMNHGRYRKANPDDIKETNKQDQPNKLTSEDHQDEPQVEAYLVNVPVNVDENEVAVLISFDVPGIKLSDIDVEYDDGVLRISGQRYNKFGYMTTFNQLISIDEGRIDTTNVSADLFNGVLKITLPKKETVKARVIPIAITSQSGEKSKEETEEPDIIIGADDVVVVESEAAGANTQITEDYVNIETDGDNADEKSSMHD